MKCSKLKDKKWDALPCIIPLRSICMILNVSYCHVYILSKKIGNEIQYVSSEKSKLVDKNEFKKWLNKQETIEYEEDKEEEIECNYVFNDDMKQPQKIKMKTYSAGFGNYYMPKSVAKIKWDEQPEFEKISYWSSLLFGKNTGTIFRWCSMCGLRHYIFPLRIYVIAKKDLQLFLGVK